MKSLVFWKLLKRRFVAIPAFCKECGRDVHDFIVPDDIWRQVEPHIKRGNVLCYDHFCEVCKGIELPGVWVLGYQLEKGNISKMGDLIEIIKRFRVSVDGEIKDAQIIAGMINRGDGGREISLAITKLQEAKMWAGKALGELGRELPPEYKDEA